VTTGAVAAERLREGFPRLRLSINPPFPPMEAKQAKEIPSGPGWSYEPKWDGFRCLAFRSDRQVVLQSKSGQPLGRYFPELVEALRLLSAHDFVLDGEIVIEKSGHLSFNDLLMRIHPAASRVQKLAKETPCTYLVFDLLVDERGHALMTKPLSHRRQALRNIFDKYGKSTRLRLSPHSEELRQAERWMKDLSVTGLDGVIAKRLDLPYLSGERRGMVKIKKLRTADCVVGGFRWAAQGGKVGSLLLGLYNRSGDLDHVGFTSSFNRDDRARLNAILKPYLGGTGFTGKAPGGPSRWSTERSGEWEPLKPKLVCEVQYDHVSDSRFRHGCKFLRWRPDKDPRQCTMTQIVSGE
jgi:ATP-dependent DNA ligase